MANQPDNDEWIAEEELAKILNVKRAAVRAERPAASSGEVKVEGNVVKILKKTARTIATKLGLAAPFLDVEKTAAAQDEGELLTVESSPGQLGYHFGNPHLIKAKRENGQVVVVRVVDSRKYVRVSVNKNPMQLRAEPATQGTWWVLVGREPRWKGAW